MTIRVLLADDQALFREAVAAMLARDGRLEIVGSVDSGDAAIAFVRAHAVDVILMDIRMPGTDGIAATREVLRLRPQTRVLVLTTFDLDEYVFGAVREGASGFLTKDATPEALADAVVAVAAGEPVMTPRATRALLGFVREGAPAGAAPAALDVLTEAPEWNPTDYAVGLSRRARGLPFWFSLATHGTEAYTTAIERTLAVTRFAAEEIRRREYVELVREPDLSVVVFRRLDWTPGQYQEWSDRLLADEFAFVVPTSHEGETLTRFAIVNPQTTEADISAILDTMA